MIYTKKKKIQGGVYGKIYQDTDPNSIIKVVDKCNIDKTHYWRQNIHEIIFLSQYNHENIIKLKDVKIHNNKIHLKLEKCEMSLYEYIEKTVLEDRIKQLPNILYQILSALYYIHKNKLIHGDLKPSNIMINCKENQMIQVKLIDFGGITSFRLNNMSNSVCTYAYSPPEGWHEFNKNGISETFDIWSLGIIIVYYLSETYLIDFPDDDSLYINKFKEISKTNKSYPIDMVILNHIDKPLQKIIKKMLILDPLKRITSKKILLSKYFSDKYGLLNKNKINYTKVEQTNIKLINLKYRGQLIDYMYDVCKNNDYLNCFCLSVILSDKYQIIKTKMINKNYKIYGISFILITSLMISKKSLYISDANEILNNQLEHNEERKVNLLINKKKIIRTIDSILKKLQFNMYYETFDWILYNNGFTIDYDLIKKTLLDHPNAIYIDNSVLMEYYKKK
ncbi:MAG: serine/threonine protein kinase [Edafosvirus sp.]|uniref:Serine/threonine protein kinase n=1 Tax=Edafosvirus sp. TaxID=2487765 RepID=A0A3G4ZUB3_9VIRU|nr:MAG: serine/threonine protein kinase [Edafosvirus sp.]